MPGASAPECGGHQVEWGLSHRRRQNTVVVLVQCRNADSPVRSAVEVVGGAVDGIDCPPQSTGAPDGTAFFGEDAVNGPHRPEHRNDGIFTFAIRSTDQVARTRFLLDVELLRLLSPAHRHTRAGLRGTLR